MPVNILFVGAGFTPARWLRFAGIAGGHKARPYRNDFGPSRARNNDAMYRMGIVSRESVFPKANIPLLTERAVKKYGGQNGYIYRGKGH
jgi:hypothetical protein